MNEKHELLKAVSLRQLDQMLQQRTAAERDHRLGNIPQPGLQPAPLPARQEDRLLRWTSGVSHK
jgi:hypothetical protein